MFKLRRDSNRISVNRKEQKQLLIHVLKHSQSTLKHYSIEDPTNQYIDLMLAPSMIDEAIEMLDKQSIGAKSLLSDYPIVEHKKKPLKGRL